MVSSLALVSHSCPSFVCSLVMTQLIWIMRSDVNKWGSDTSVSSQWLEFHTTEHKRPPQLPHLQPCVSDSTLLSWETAQTMAAVFVCSSVVFCSSCNSQTADGWFSQNCSLLIFLNLSWSHVVLFRSCCDELAAVLGLMGFTACFVVGMVLVIPMGKSSIWLGFVLIKKRRKVALSHFSTCSWDVTLYAFIWTFWMKKGPDVWVTDLLFSSELRLLFLLLCSAIETKFHAMFLL